MIEHAIAVSIHARRLELNESEKQEKITAVINKNADLRMQMEQAVTDNSIEQVFFAFFTCNWHKITSILRAQPPFRCLFDQALVARGLYRGTREAGEPRDGERYFLDAESRWGHTACTIATSSGEAEVGPLCCAVFTMFLSY